MNRLLPLDYQGERYGLHFRFVTEDDSEFIVKLRTNQKLSRFIGSTDNDVEKQRQWIRDYKQREENGLDYYFMFEMLDGTKLGMERIYDITEKSFVTGSWVFDQRAPYGAAFLGDIIAHEIAYELFPNKAHLHSIEKANLNVLKYARLFNPKIIDETETSYYFRNEKEDFDIAKRKLLRSILPVFLKATNQQ